MKAILLCAGYATRMGELTKDFPKALLPVAGRPILDDLVDQLGATGRVDSILVVSNDRDFVHFERWQASRVEDDAGHPVPSITLVNDGTRSNEGRLGAVGDLAMALEHLGAAGPVLVGAGDNLFRFDLGAYLEDFREGETSMVLLSHERDPAKLSRSGVAEVDDAGRLIRLWEKPESPPSEFCCPPLYLLTSEALAEIAPFQSECPEADAPGHLIAWLAERLVVRTHLMRGDRLDVGNAESYHAAEAWLQGHPKISPKLK